MTAESDEDWLTTADRLRAEQLERERLFQRAFGTGGFTCPICGENLIHPTGVHVNAGGSLTDIDDDGTRCRIGPASERGVLICLAFHCECGARFSMSLQFHKGSTKLWLEDNGTWADGNEPTWVTIWRD